MNKKEFLGRLRKKLEKLPSHLVEDIIDDYIEHYELGKESGKTEEQISQELGSPDSIATEYLDQYKHRISEDNDGFTIQYKTDNQFSKGLETVFKVIFIIIIAYALFTLIPSVLGATLGLVQALLIFVGIIIVLTLIGGLVGFFFLKDKLRNISDGNIRFTSKKEERNGALFTVFEQKRFEKESINSVKVSAQLEKINLVSENREDILVSIEGKTNLDYNDFIIEQVGTTLNIRTKLKYNVLNNVNSNLVIIVKTPNTKLFDLDLDASMGSVHVEGNYGHSAIKADMGSLKVTGQQQEVNYKCSMGSVKLIDFDGYGNIDVAMGSTTLIGDQFSGIVKAKTSMGNVKVNRSVVSQSKEGSTTTIVIGNSNKVLTINSQMGSIKIG